MPRRGFRSRARHHHHHHHRHYGRRRFYIPVPPTTDLTVIFPYSSSTSSFNSTFYADAYPDGRATTSEVQEVLNEFYLASKPMRSKASCCFLTCLLMCVVCFIVLIVYGFLIVPKGPSGIGIGIFILMLAAMLFLFAGGYSRRHYTRKTHSAVLPVIAKYNETFIPRGLRWQAPPGQHLRWIELHKTYKMAVQMQPMGVTIQMPMQQPVFWTPNPQGFPQAMPQQQAYLQAYPQGYPQGVQQSFSQDTSQNYLQPHKY